MAYKESVIQASWRPGYRAKIPASVAAKRLSELAARSVDRIVTPKMIVDDARPEDSPLHPAFEWRDDVAAEKYREEQARAMVRALVIPSPVSKEPENPKFIRLFENVRQTVPSDTVDQSKQDEDPYQERLELNGYRNTIESLQDRVYRRQIFDAVVRDLQAFVEKFEAYREICGEIPGFDEILVRGRQFVEEVKRRQEMQSEI